MILCGQKRLLRRVEIKPVDVEHYPEISVKGLYSEFADRADVAFYMPPKINKGRQCDKEYFWTVVNTLYEQEVEAMVGHANYQRTGVDGGDLEQEAITVSNEMMDLMQKHPWVSVSTYLFLA